MTRKKEEPGAVNAGREINGTELCQEYHNLIRTQCVLQRAW
jgi:hypothetical protein